MQKPKQDKSMETMVTLMRTNQAARTAVVQNSHAMFARTYFGHYFKYPFADFHDELFAHTEDSGLRFLVVLAFRGSGKSTILSLSLPIWSVVGTPQKKCILIIGQTQKQAQQYLANIKEELSTNPLLMSDLGPFEEQNEQWNSGAIVIKQYGAKIIALSREQSIRGLRHLQHRPDLVICDDVEDIESTKTLENRDTNFEWLTSEVIPCGNEHTQFVYVGNLVNEDCILERLRKAIEAKRMDGVFLRVPIIGSDDQPTWPQRFPDADAVEAFRRTVPSDAAWHREYMLKIVDTDDRLLRSEQIQYYDKLPKEERCRYLVLGTDLAVSMKPGADFSAFVPVAIYGSGKDRKIYVLPHVINAKMMLHQSKSTMMNKADALDSLHSVEILIEDVTFQEAIGSDLRQEGYRVKMVPLHGMNKRERLERPASWVAQGQVLFPKQGAEKLIDQLVNFGLTQHDDLCDAFSLGVNYLIDKTKSGNMGIALGDFRHIEIPDIDKEAIECQVQQQMNIVDQAIRYRKALRQRYIDDGIDPKYMSY